MSQNCKSSSMSAVNCSNWLSLSNEPMVLIGQPIARNFYERMMLTRQFYHQRCHQRADSPGGAIVSTGQLLNRLALEYSVPDTSREDEERDRAQLPLELRVATPRPCSSIEVQARMRQSEWRRKLGGLLSPNPMKSPRVISTRSAEGEDNDENNGITPAATNGHIKESITVTGSTRPEVTNSNVLSLPSSSRSTVASARLPITSPSTARSAASRSQSARQKALANSVQLAQHCLFLEARGRTLGIRNVAPEYLSSGRRQQQPQRSQSAFGRIESRRYPGGHHSNCLEPVDKPQTTEAWADTSNNGEIDSARPSDTTAVPTDAQSIDKDLTTVHKEVAEIDGHSSGCADCFYCRILKGRESGEPGLDSNREELSSVDLVLRYYEEKDKLHANGDKNNDNHQQLKQVSRHEHCFHSSSHSSTTSSIRVGRSPSPRSARRPKSGRKGQGREAADEVILPSRPTTPASIPSNSRPPSVGGSRPSSASGDIGQPLSFIITTRSLQLKTKYINNRPDSHKS